MLLDTQPPAINKARRIAQVDDWRVKLVSGQFVTGLPYTFGKITCFWVKFADTAPQGIVTLRLGPGDELRLHYGIAGAGSVSLAAYLFQGAYPGLTLAPGVWHLLALVPVTHLWANGVLYDIGVSPGTDHPSENSTLGKAYDRNAGIFRYSNAEFGSYFQFNNIYSGFNFPPEHTRFLEMAYNNGRGCDIRRLPFYEGNITLHLDFHPDRTFQNPPWYAGNTYITPIRTTEGFNGATISSPSIETARRVGKFVFDPLSAGWSVAGTGTPVTRFSAAFNAPAGTDINNYVPETGPQLTRLISGWIASVTPPVFTGTGRLTTASGYSAMICALAQNSVRAVIQDVQLTIAGGATGVQLFSNAQGTTAIRAQINFDTAQSNQATLYIVFDGITSLQAGGPTQVSKTIAYAPGLDLVVDTNGTSITVTYGAESLSRTTALPYTGQNALLFMGESNSSTISGFTVTDYI